MNSFSEQWRDAVTFRKVSRELEGLVEAVYLGLTQQSDDLAALKRALVALLTFLSAEGRTDANCCATDAFFARVSRAQLQSLPTEYQVFIELLSGALHDSVYAPHISSTFESLPEQLLSRALALPA